MKTLTSKQIAKHIRIGQPLKNARVTQWFGPSTGQTQKWYESFGWKGHNGIDFGVPKKTRAYAVYPGVVREAYGSASAGYVLNYDTDPMVIDGVECRLRFHYFHLSAERAFEVRVGDRVEPGQWICNTGNTGKYTTGAHLHFGVSVIYIIDGIERKDTGNGYSGAVDPKPLFVSDDFANFPVSKQYGKKRNWVLEYTFRFANTPVGEALTPFLQKRIEAARYVHRVLKARSRSNPMLTDNETNAIIYGSWDLETVLDPAMFPVWGWWTKAEYTKRKDEGLSLKPPIGF